MSQTVIGSKPHPVKPRYARVITRRHLVPLYRRVRYLEYAEKTGKASSHNLAELAALRVALAEMRFLIFEREKLERDIR